MGAKIQIQQFLNEHEICFTKGYLFFWTIDSPCNVVNYRFFFHFWCWMQSLSYQFSLSGLSVLLKQWERFPYCFSLTLHCHGNYFWLWLLLLLSLLIICSLLLPIIKKKMPPVLLETSSIQILPPIPQTSMFIFVNRILVVSLYSGSHSSLKRVVLFSP